MTNKQFIFVLKADGYGEYKIIHSPKGWDAQQISITRSPTYKGLTRKRTNTLSFVLDGFKWIQNVYEKEGPNYAGINLGIYEYTGKEDDKYVLYFPGIIDLSTYKYYYDNTGEGCKVEVNESTLARKMMSRDDAKVNIGRTDSIDGTYLGATPVTTLQIHEREISLQATYQWDDLVTSIGTTISSYDGNVSGFTLPMKVDSSNIDNLVSAPSGNVDSSSSLFWVEADFDQSLKIEGTIRGSLGGGPSNKSGVRYMAFRVYEDDTLTSWNDHVIWQSNGEAYNLNVSFDVDVDFTLDVLSVEQIALIVYANQPDYYEGYFSQIDFTVYQNVLFGSTRSPGYKIHDVAQRICEVIADQEGILYSEFLGDKEQGYAEDGEASQQVILSGKQIRNIPFSHPTIKLKDFFNDINAQRNIGFGIEYSETGQPFFRLEKTEHFFNGDVIATLHNCSDIGKEVAREWIYSSVEVGYKKAEYEEVDGLQEYNNQFEWNTVFTAIQNKLSLISGIRADGYGIEYARRSQYSTDPTKDTKYDKDNFIVVAHKEGNIYVADTDENYDFVENIFSSDSATNLDITPGRMLRNNGDAIRAGLEKELSSPLVFMDAEQEENLKSQRTGEAAITENENIDVSTLNAGRWIPEIYSFKSTMNRELFEAISKNQNGIVKFSPYSRERTSKYYYGWILEAKAEEGESEFQLLRVNTACPEVRLNDPEGNSPYVPPPTVVPWITCGFEATFPLIFCGVEERSYLLEDGDNYNIEDGTNLLLE